MVRAGEVVEARHALEATGAQLSLEVGERLVVERDVNEHWLMARSIARHRDGKRGLVPRSYVRVVDGGEKNETKGAEAHELAASRRRVRVLTAYHGAEKEHGITAREGQELVVVKDSGAWLYCAAQGGARGYIPARHVQPLAEEAEEGKPRVILLKDFEGQADLNQLPGLVQGARVTVLRVLNGGWTYAEDEAGRRGYVPSKLLQEMGRKERPATPGEQGVADAAHAEAEALLADGKACAGAGCRRRTLERESLCAGCGNYLLYRQKLLRQPREAEQVQQGDVYGQPPQNGQSKAAHRHMQSALMHGILWRYAAG